MPSIAQKRVMQRQAALALRTAEALDSEDVSGGYIRRFLRLDLFGYGARQTAKALGTRAGVPDEAAVCDTGHALREFDSGLAALVEDPELLMRDPGSRPEARRPFVHVDSSYPELVHQAVGAGLQEFGDVCDAVHSMGKPQQGRDGGQVDFTFGIRQRLRGRQSVAPPSSRHTCRSSQLSA